jgi:hypothetical protein
MYCKHCAQSSLHVKDCFANAVPFLHTHHSCVSHLLTAHNMHCTCVLQSVAELEAARGELGTQAATAAGEVARLSVALQELAQQRVGLAHKLTV